MKSIPFEQRCNKCGKARDEFSLTTFYNRYNKPEYRVCDDCYATAASGEFRNRYFYGEGVGRF